MPIYLQGKTMIVGEEQTTEAPLDMEEVLRRLVTDFSVAPLANGKRMRDLMRADRDAFRLAALTLLHEISDIRGARYIVTLLWTNDLLIQTLSDSTLPLSLALRVSETAAKVDPQLHFRLMRYLITGMLEGQEIEESRASRLLEVLSFIADATSIQPFLRQLLLHPSQRIRSKITLLAGRGHAGIKALGRLVKDEDARVRANAIEALWTSSGAGMVELFRESLADTSNRVRGNALIGLYMAGDTASIASLVELSAQSPAVCRATAAWAMGRTEDPRFLPLLGRMMGESKGQLRKSVFRAIEAIKKASHRRAEIPSLNIDIVDLQTLPELQRVRIRSLVSSQESVATPELRATDFLINTGVSTVADYACQDLHNETIALGFLLPRRPGTDDPRRPYLEAALQECLNGKPRPEQWSILRYREQSNEEGVVAPLRIFGQVVDSDTGSREKQEGTAATFTGNSAALLATIGDQGLRTDSGAGMAAACYEALRGRWPARGVRNLIAVVEENFSPDLETLEALIKAACSLHVAVHSMCIARSEALAELCRQTGGICRVASTADEIRSQLRIIYGAVKRQYILEFPFPPSLGDITQENYLRLQVHSDVGCGEGIWPGLPQPAAQKACE